MSFHSIPINMDAAVIFHGRAPLLSFQEFSARDPQLSGCNVNDTARQQVYESYKAEYTEALFHIMVARCPHLTFSKLGVASTRSEPTEGLSPWVQDRNTGTSHQEPRQATQLRSHWEVRDPRRRVPLLRKRRLPDAIRTCCSWNKQQ